MDVRAGIGSRLFPHALAKGCVPSKSQAVASSETQLLSDVYYGSRETERLRETGRTIDFMPEKPTNTSDVLQSHEHSQLSSEAIAKALARHNREHKGDQQQKQQADAKAKSKKAGK